MTEEDFRQIGLEKEWEHPLDDFFCQLVTRADNILDSEPEDAQYVFNMRGYEDWVTTLGKSEKIKELILDLLSAHTLRRVITVPAVLGLVDISGRINTLMRAAVSLYQNLTEEEIQELNTLTETLRTENENE